MLIIGEQQKFDEGIKALRKQAKENQEILACGLDLSDDFLSSFVYGKNGDQKKAYKTLQNYVAVRKGKYKDFFKTVIPSRCLYFRDIPKFMGFSKHKDEEGRIVALFNLGIVNFNVVDIEDIFRGLVIVAEELITAEELSRNGVVIVIDCRGMGFHHVKVFTPSRIQFMFNIFVGTYPIKYKGFHVLYDSYVFDPLLKVFKMFAPKKIRERIFLHGSSVESLHKTVPKSILPLHLGGELMTDEDCYDFALEDKAYNREEHYQKIAQKW